MEAYEVHSTFQSSEHADQRVCMGLSVVETGKHRIFEADSSLTGEVILLDQIDDFLYRPRALNRHYAQTFRSERIVEADSQMALAFIQISLEIRKYADG